MWTPGASRSLVPVLTAFLMLSVPLALPAAEGRSASVAGPEAGWPGPRDAVFGDDGVVDAAAPEVGGRDDIAPDSTGDDHARRLKWFPPRLYAGGIFYLPEATYSDHRGFGLGGQILYPFRWPGSSASVPASELGFAGRITLKGQTRADLQALLHPGRNTAYKIRISHETLVERYYGIGPDTPSEAEEIYRPSDLQAYVEAFRDVWRDFRLGARVELERVELLETEDGGALASGDVRGAPNGQNAIGVGVTLDWDRRDARYFPRRGFYLQGFAMGFGKELGSQFPFSNHHVDARAYVPLAENHVLALQFFGFAAKGAPPFWRYAELGGRAHSRGYRRGRYRDRLLLASQAEYRVRLYWRFGIAAFAGIADVASGFDRMELEHMKPSVGGGPRFFLGEWGHELTVRFDVGIGGGVPRYYFSLGEAF